VFIFVDRKKLNDDYFGYEKTKLAHPMPDIVFFKDRKKVKNKEEIIVDESGVAIRIKNDQTDDVENTARPQSEKVAKQINTKEVISDDAEDAYEDKWDD
ncbi:MAG: hypothetical protein K2I75_05330, partial [Clostridiales bacterium]|nr:hypothetical protein [Clostridiales bacterium]